MKWSVLILIFVVGTIFQQRAWASAESPQILAGPFDWSGEVDTLRGANGLNAYVNEVHCLSLQTAAQAPAVYTLRTLGPAIVSEVTTLHYAIIGHLSYSNVAPGSFLEMENWFAPEHPGGPEAFYYSRTLADAGPLAKLEGSDDDHDFALPFDATGSKTHLSRLVLKLHLMGAGILAISNVRLVQYPDAASAPTPKAAEPTVITISMGADNLAHRTIDGTDYSSVGAFKTALQQMIQADAEKAFVLRGTQQVPYAAVKETLDALRDAGAKNVAFSTVVETNKTPRDPESASPTTGTAFDPRSFFLGILAAVIAAAAFGSMFWLTRWWQGRAKERELRRISSLDG